jgi:hypothetical protein
MAIPKKIKKTLPLIPEKTGKERRQELLDDITDGGTFLPKGVLHADLDKGMLDFVKDRVELVVDGKKVPTVDRIITNQSWAQFTQTWDFQDLDKNISLPFIVTLRAPEVKYGTNNAGKANIPERRQFFYYTVPTWNGERKGADVYRIPQPIPVDLTFTIKLFCNRMREVNEFNKIMMRTFTSKQAYTQIKGHYIPMTLEEVSDESAKDLEKRKYYISSYKINMMGLLIDEEEFEVTPAITRQLTLFEFESNRIRKKAKIEPPNLTDFPLDFLFVSGNTQLIEVFRYDADITVDGIINLVNCYDATYSSITNNTLTYTDCSGTITTLPTVSGDSGTICVKSSTQPLFNTTSGGTITLGESCIASYSVYINNNYLGDNLTTIQINNGDVLKIIVYKDNLSEEAIIKTKVSLV